MGGLLSQPTLRDSTSSLPSTHSGHVNEDFEISFEISRLRRMVKDRSKLILLEKYVFIFFCPPNYPSNSIAQYIRDRVDIPIFPSKDMNNLSEAMKDQKYQNGFILLTFSSKYEDVKAFKLKIEDLGMKLCLFFFEVDGEVCENTEV
jgi:hypothetical protein